MRVNKNFIAREVAGEYILIPAGEAALQIHGMICLSESGYLLYQKLQEDCTAEALVQTIRSEYDVEPGVAKADVEDFLDQMRQVGLLVEG